MDVTVSSSERIMPRLLVNITNDYLSTYYSFCPLTDTAHVLLKYSIYKLCRRDILHHSHTIIYITQYYQR